MTATVRGTRHLTLLCIFDTVPSDVFCLSASLQCLTGLQCLSIENTGPDFGFSRDHIQVLASILDKIPSLTLKNIHFGFNARCSTLPSRGWHQIGKVLQQSRFSQLAEVVFSFHESGSRNGTEEWIRSDLPALEERGILSFRVLPPFPET